MIQFDEYFSNGLKPPTKGIADVFFRFKLVFFFWGGGKIVARLFGDIIVVKIKIRNRLLPLPSCRRLQCKRCLFLNSPPGISRVSMELSSQLVSWFTVFHLSTGLTTYLL